MGRTDDAFDEQLLQEIITRQIPEGSELEWKQQIPSRKKPGSIDETAKDFAALANGVGGTIVYGMIEDTLTTAAAGLQPLEVDFDPQQHLRQITYSAIRPALTAVEFEVVNLSTDDAERGGFALVVTVQPSTESPHLVWTKDGQFRAPKRHGAQTVDMTEVDLEHAYRDRFTRRRETREQLESKLKELATRAIGSPPGGMGAPGPHLVGLARPLSNTATQDADVSSESAQRILYEAHRKSLALHDGPPGGTIGETMSAPLRRGRRSWRRCPNDRRNLEWRVGPEAEVSIRQRIGGPELFGDRVEPLGVPATRIERAIRDLICLASARAETTGPAGEWEVVATVVWGEDAAVNLLIEDEVPGYFHSIDESDPVHSFQASEVVTMLPAPLEHLLEPMMAMATDLVSQGGLPRLYALPNAMR